MHDAAALAGADREFEDGSADAAGPVAVLSKEQASELVVRTIQAHADALLRTARRHSLCADDAHDAYQRGMEIFMRRAATIDPERAPAWLTTVIKHEAMAVRASRQQFLGPLEVDLDAHEGRTIVSPEEQLLSYEVVARAAEALQRLKPQEARALWLKAEGHSYNQIAETTGWTYTKVNRAITEGRRAFMARYAGIESGEECDRWAPVVSAMIDGEATPEQVLEARPHLHNCPACRAMVREAHRQSASIAALFPVAAVGGAGAAQGGPAPDAGSWLARLYEAAASALHERAAASALKVQAVLDTASAGKIAAVAASAAAVAGGGIAVVEPAVEHHRADGRHVLAHRAPAGARESTAAAGAPAPSRPAPARRTSAASEEFGSSGTTTSSRQVSREFGGPRAGAAAVSQPTAPSAPAAPVRRLRPVDAEFGP